MLSDLLFHGEFTSADASALTEPNSRILLYPPGSLVAITIGATDVVVVTDLKIRVGATGVVTTIYDGADNVVSAGERISLGTFPASVGEYQTMNPPHFCQAGTWPKVKTSGAGQIDVQIHGYIRFAT